MERRAHRARALPARLLVPVKGSSGSRYPAGTEVRVRGGGASADAFVAGDWLALSWWEYAPLDPRPGSEAGVRDA